MATSNIKVNLRIPFRIQGATDPVNVQVPGGIRDYHKAVSATPRTEFSIEDPTAV